MEHSKWIKDFSNNLDRVMKERNLSQQDMAELLGVTRATVSRYLSGKQEPTLSSAINIANSLNCKLKDLADTTQLIDRRS